MRLTLCLVLVCLAGLPGCSKKDKNTVATPLGTKTAVLDPNADPRGNVYGEKILPAIPRNLANKEQPLRRHSRTPFFRLSNIRTEESEWGFGGRKVLLIDFSRTETGDAGGFSVYMVVRSKFHRGPAQGLANFDSADHGTMRLSLIDNNGFGIPTFTEKKNEGPIDLEIWLEQRFGVGNQNFKVSNSVTFGQMDGEIHPREWNEFEEKIITRWVRTDSMLPPVPEGYVKVDEKTRLLPGAPVLTVDSEFEYEPAEFLRFEPPQKPFPRSYLVRAGNPPRDPTTETTVLVKSDTLEAMTTDPGKFKPSINVLPTGTNRIPEGWVIVDLNTPLVPGTPLQCEQSRDKWDDVTVVEPRTNSGKVNVHWIRWGGKDEEKNHDELIISKHTLGLLQQPNAAEQFKDNAFKAKYNISDDFPKGYIPVPEGVTLIPGMTIQARDGGYGSRWQTGTILTVEGPRLSVRWSGTFSKIESIDSAGILVSETSLAEVKDPKLTEELAARAKAQTVGDDEAPPGYRAIDEQTRIVKGVPVIIEDYGRWKDFTVLRVLEDNSLRIGDPASSGHWDKTVTRDKVLISKETLTALDDPVSVEKYQKALLKQLRETRRQYPIETDIPAKAVAVTKNMRLQVGTPLGACWGWRWHDVTVVDASDEDMIRVEGGSPFRGGVDMFREDLIIEKTVLAKLEREKKAEAKEKQLQKERAAAAEKAGAAEPPKDSPFKEE